MIMNEYDCFLFTYNAAADGGGGGDDTLKSYLLHWVKIFKQTNVIGKN